MAKPQIDPLFRADTVSPTFTAEKDGRVKVTYRGWDDHKVVPPGHAFEVRWGRQGAEGRIVPLPGPSLEDVVLGAISDARGEVDCTDEILAQTVLRRLGSAGYLIVRAAE